MIVLWQLVTINSEWLVDSMDSLSPTLSKEWIGLILLPVVSSIAGKADSHTVMRTGDLSPFDRMRDGCQCLCQGSIDAEHQCRSRIIHRALPISRLSYCD